MPPFCAKLGVMWSWKRIQTRSSSLRAWLYTNPVGISW